MAQNKFAMVPVYPVHHIPAPSRRLPTRASVREIMAEQIAGRKQEERDQRAVERASYVSNHPLIKGHEPRVTGNSTVDTLNMVKHQLAREAASLEFDRADRDRRGVDTSQLSSKIVSAWKQVSNIELNIKKVGVTVIDPNSEEMQRVHRMWIDVLREVMTEMVTEGMFTAEVLDLFFNKFSGAMEGWEERLHLRE